MIQVIIGRVNYEGSIKAFYKAGIPAEQFSYEKLTEVIIKGLNANIALFSDPGIVTSLSQSQLNTIYDLLCLIYKLREQKVGLVVTDVKNDVSTEGNNTILKVITPVCKDGIHRAIDFGFNSMTEKIDITEVVTSINKELNLFDPSIFIDNPIDAITESLPNLESAGIPTSGAQDELTVILQNLGFQFLAVLNDED